MGKKRMFSRLKALNKGWKRLNLVVSILFGWFGFMIIDEWDLDDIFYDIEEFLLFITGVLILFICYWIIVRIVIWIIDGFNE